MTFQLLKPNSLSEVFQILEDFQNDAVLLAGGTDLVPLLHHEAVEPKHIVALGRIKGLDERYADGEDLCLGPMVTHQQAVRSSLIQQYGAALAEASGTVGSLQTRNMGTIAGNLANASPSADSAPALLVLNAELKLGSRAGEEKVPLASFFQGPKKTCLKPTQMILEIRFKQLARLEGAAYVKVGRRSAVTMAVASAAAYVRLDKSGTAIEELRLALGSVAPTPVRLYALERNACGIPCEKVFQVIRPRVRDGIRPISDIRGTKEYRERIASVLAERAVEEAIRRARDR